MGAAGLERPSTISNIGHIGAIDLSYIGTYQSACKMVALKWWDLLDTNNLPTFEDINNVYKRSNSAIRNRSTFGVPELMSFRGEIELRVHNCNKLFVKWNTINKHHKYYKGDIQKLGGHPMVRILIKGLPSCKAFYVSTWRLINDGLIPWHICFGPRGRGSVSMDGRILSETRCWVCKGYIHTRSLEVLHGFARPWCNKKSCVDMVMSLAPTLAKRALDLNNKALLKA